jgi:hypothetical protein
MSDSSPIIVALTRRRAQGQMHYPRDFTIEAQAAVEQAKIDASEAYDKATDINHAGIIRAEERQTNFLRQWVCSIMLAFAQQSCKLGREGVMTAATIDYEVSEFLNRLAYEADTERCFLKGGASFNAKLTFAGKISNAEMNRVRGSGEWKQYQRLLKGVTRIQQRAAFLTQRSKGHPMIKQLRLDARLTQQRLADLTGFNVKTIKRHEARQSVVSPLNKGVYERVFEDLLGHPVSIEF